jgi:hypothetical protein
MTLASASTTPVAAEPAAVETTDVAAAESLPPIYEPLIDMHRVDRTKYNRDLASCREQAAPQEKAARAAAQQQANGVALQTMGTMASFLPVVGWQAQRAVNVASNTAIDVGNAASANGAVTGANATADYALVVNTCLTHRGYRLLRA